VSVRSYVCNAGRGANHVIMRIAGLVTDGTGRRYGDWRHVATGCNTLVCYNFATGFCFQMCVIFFYQSPKHSSHWRRSILNQLYFVFLLISIDVIRPNRPADSKASELLKWLVHTHTHTLNRFVALFPGLPRWAGTRKKSYSGLGGAREDNTEAVRPTTRLVPLYPN